MYTDSGDLLEWAARHSSGAVGNLGRVTLAGMVDAYSVLSGIAQTSAFEGAARAMPELLPDESDEGDRGVALSFLALYYVVDQWSDPAAVLAAVDLDLAEVFAGALAADPLGTRGELFLVLAGILAGADGPAGVGSFLDRLGGKYALALESRLPADLYAAAGRS